MTLYTIVAFPDSGASDRVVIRNEGAESVDLAGWTLSDASGRESLVFGERPACPTVVAPGNKLELTPRGDDEPCGLPFTVSFSDKLTLADSSGREVSSVEWQGSQQGTAMQLMPDGTYVLIRESGTLLDTLRSAGVFTILVEALEATGLAEELSAATDPEFRGSRAPSTGDEDQGPFVANFPWCESPPPGGAGPDTPPSPDPPIPSNPPPPARPRALRWFGFNSGAPVDLLPEDEALLDSAEGAPREEGIPAKGPFTLLAPTDAAFQQMLADLGGFRGPLDRQVLLRLPELRDILLYHVVPGLFDSSLLISGGSYATAKLPDVVVFREGAAIRLHDACVDRPTPDGFTCAEQRDFGACLQPFMTNPAEDWPAGYCQLTCERCTCDGSVPCSDVSLPDLRASNGVVHGIDRVLFAPPVFEAVPASPRPDPFVADRLTDADFEALLRQLPGGQPAVESQSGPP